MIVEISSSPIAPIEYRYAKDFFLAQAYNTKTYP